MLRAVTIVMMVCEDPATRVEYPPRPIPHCQLSASPQASVTWPLSTWTAHWQTWA